MCEHPPVHSGVQREREQDEDDSQAEEPPDAGTKEEQEHSFDEGAEGRGPACGGA